ncbi:hypothetical protein [Curtobacterium sp. BRB10]|uniref:hypothetical protein n=1 Tax=Curtobacterium sp. BRB10 TaxID=2962579 RepID=UPI00288193DC|nr:hypothetical protein [Curtobacterium sp. BRB10]MDT0234446.1 hypothetical protein [Curtobacterium sp. BRB10]
MLDGTSAPGVHPAVIEALAILDRNRPNAAEALIQLEHSRERFAESPLPRVVRNRGPRVQSLFSHCRREVLRQSRFDAPWPAA